MKGLVRYAAEYMRISGLFYEKIRGAMSSGVLIFGIIMLVSLWFIVDFWKREDSRFSIVIILLFGINVLAALCILYYTNVIGSRAEKIYKNEENLYTMSKSYTLGKYLADKYPGGTALIIAAPDYKKSEDFKVLLQGFQKGFNKKITIGAVEGINIIADNKPGTRPPPLWKVMQAVDFDNLINKHPECNIVITTIGLPEDLYRMDIWFKPDKTRPKLAVMNSYMFLLRKAIEQGLITAATASVPGNKATMEYSPENIDKAFEARYILVTKENIETMIKKYRSLFFLN